MRSPIPKRHLARAVSLVVAAALAMVAGCHPTPGGSSGDAATRPPAVDHGDPPPFEGTWVGPALRLTFAGPWVLVSPVDSGEGGERTAVPIELRVEVLRREGEAAFALETSVAGVMPADFLRPIDWTMLVEPGELALAMGDEPLEAYVLDPDAPAPLLGPSLLDELPLPERLPFADASACLERASLDCAALEADGPPAAGCREALWAACVGHRLERASADPTTADSQVARLALKLIRAELRYAAGLAAADGSPAAAAFERRAFERAATVIATLIERGQLPLADPEPGDLGHVLDALERAVTRGILADDRVPELPTQ